MSKETKKEFNILNTSFGDGMEVNFTDEFKEDFSVDTKPTEGQAEYAEPGFEQDKETTKVDANKSKEEPIVKDAVPSEVEAKETIVEETEEESSSLKHFASWLGDKGLVDFDEATFEDSEDGLKKLMSTTIDKEIQNYKNSLPEDLHKLVEFVESGGNPKDFINAYYNEATWEDYELESEHSQKIVLREYLKAQGEDPEEIEETIDTYEVSNILEKKAKSALSKLQSLEKGYQEKLVESQKKYAAEQREEQKKQYESFKAELYSKEEIQGFKLTPKMKDNLWDFMMKPDKTGKTGLQKHDETNKNASFMYAYLAYNNWDIEKLERQVKTKVNSELASKLSNYKDSRSKLKSGQTESFSQERSSNNFSAFGKALRDGNI